VAAKAARLLIREGWAGLMAEVSDSLGGKALAGPVVAADVFYHERLLVLLQEPWPPLLLAQFLLAAQVWPKGLLRDLTLTGVPRNGDARRFRRRPNSNSN